METDQTFIVNTTNCKYFEASVSSILFVISCTVLLELF